VGSIETFDHTADVGLRLRGDDLADLFVTAARGVFGYIVVNLDEVRALDPEPVSLRAESTADLLVAWLNELIFRSETRHRLYARFEIAVAADGLALGGHVAGEPIDPVRHVLDHEVKAVTRHGLELRPEPAGGWLAEVILDI
jgi:SHS2 domain-containing protein